MVPIRGPRGLSELLHDLFSETRCKAEKLKVLAVLRTGPGAQNLTEPSGFRGFQPDNVRIMKLFFGHLSDGFL